MGLWGHRGQLEALKYVLLLQHDSGYATAFLIPYDHPEEGTGVIGVYSCGASTRAQRERYGHPPGSHAPHWEHFEAVWYPACFLGDLMGMIQGKARALGELGGFLDRILPQWRVSHQQAYGEYYYDSLRRIFADVGVAVWIEVSEQLQ